MQLSCNRCHATEVPIEFTGIEGGLTKQKLSLSDRPNWIDSAEEGQGQEEEEQQQSSNRRRRRGTQKRGLEDLREDWAWLDGMNAEDRPWLYFGLYRALNSRVRQNTPSRSDGCKGTCLGHLDVITGVSPSMSCGGWCRARLQRRGQRLRRPTACNERCSTMTCRQAP